MEKVFPHIRRGRWNSLWVLGENAKKKLLLGPLPTSNVNDIETKAKRNFDPPIFSISNWNKTAYSKIFWIEEDQTNLVQQVLEQRPNKPAYSKIFKIKEDRRG